MPGQEAALKALDDAFTDEVKARLGTLCGNLASGMAVIDATGKFQRAYQEILTADELARKVIKSNP